MNETGFDASQFDRPAEIHSQKLDRNPFKEGDFTPAIEAMYQVAGQDKISQHSFKRYVKDKELYDKKIHTLADTPSLAPTSYDIESPFSETEIDIVQGMSIEKRADFIKNSLENANQMTQEAWASVIDFAPQPAQAALRLIVAEKIKAALRSENLQLQTASVNLIYYAPNEEKAALISQCMHSGIPEVQRASVAQIRFLPNHDEALALIREGINGDSPNLLEELAFIMSHYYADEEKSALDEELIEKIAQGFRSEQPEMQAAAARAISFAPRAERASLSKQAIDMGLGHFLIQTSLYKHKDINNERFSRSQFDKTGYEIILVGGPLQYKSIIRKITPDAFLAWQKVYEDYEMWEHNGFDYVPIEPILSYSLDKDGLVEVHSGILDLSLADWIEKSDLFIQELEEQKDEITKIVMAYEVDHGHEHYGNFCLRFFRDPQGQADFSRIPRLYLIDFDRAVS